MPTSSIRCWPRPSEEDERHLADGRPAPPRAVGAVPDLRRWSNCRTGRSGRALRLFPAMPPRPVRPCRSPSRSLPPGRRRREAGGAESGAPARRRADSRSVDGLVGAVGRRATSPISGRKSSRSSPASTSTGWRGFYTDIAIDPPPYETRPNCLMVNRNKLGATLDLKSDAGRNLVLDLARVSDVMIEKLCARRPSTSSGSTRGR